MDKTRHHAKGQQSGRASRREFLQCAISVCASMAGLAGGISPAIARAGSARTILVFGDSLSAGLGMAKEQAWPSLLEHELVRRGGNPGWTVVNASISGETTHGGVARLAATLARVAPAIVILELGGNDALRGLPIEDSRRNLEQMAAQVERYHARLLVVGIALPPNFGDDFSAEFAQLFSSVAKRHQAPLLPNLVEALGTGREEFQADGIHPLARAQPKLMASVLKHLEPLLLATGKGA